MAKGDHFFKLYYQRILTSTQGWKDDEFGAYMRLLIYQFDKGFIPEDFDTLTRIAPSSKKNWRILSTKFIKNSEGKLINDVMDGIRNDRDIKSEKNSENGKKGGRPKKQNESETKPNGYKNKSESKAIPLVNGMYGNSSSLNGLQGNFSSSQPIVQTMKEKWMELKPKYPFSEVEDLTALFSIGDFISVILKEEWLPETDVGKEKVLSEWISLSEWVCRDKFYKDLSLTMISKTSTLQTIWQKSKDENGTNKQGFGFNRKQSAVDDFIEGATAEYHTLSGRATGS